MTALRVDQEGAEALERRLLQELERLGSALVAFSAGVDSTYVAWAARRALGERALAVTGFSASVARREREEAERLARMIGIAHLTLATEELEDPRYVANTPQRCYFCKSDLYGRLSALARERGYAAVLDGTNSDDLGEPRPGRRAAAEGDVRSPLAELGLGKQAVRWLSLKAGLPTWDKPAQPCLSSRIPHGSPVTPDKLARVERAEEAMRALGFREFRVRHLGRLARVELAAADLARALEVGLSARIVAAVLQTGFQEVLIDREPFRSGRLSAESSRSEDSARG